MILAVALIFLCKSASPATVPYIAHLSNRLKHGQDDMENILKNSGSDKHTSHHFEVWYEPWLEPYRRKKELKLLEIGAKAGNSLLASSKYFKEPELILGLAYGDQTENLEANVKDYGHESIDVMFGDQSKEESLRKACQRGPFDVIIDDGSHLPAHQISSFFYLWKCLNMGGIYIVEDVETSYWDKKKPDEVYGYELHGAGMGQPPPGNAVEKFKQFVEVLNRIPIGYRSLSIMPVEENKFLK